jgi:hypothetical protein
MRTRISSVDLINSARLVYLRDDYLGNTQAVGLTRLRLGWCACTLYRIDGWDIQVCDYTRILFTYSLLRWWDLRMTLTYTSLVYWNNRVFRSWVYN